MKDIVIPGELLFDKPMHAENTYTENGKTYSSVLGLFEKEKGAVVSLEGAWQPRIGDVVVGIVANVKNSVYEMELSFFGRSILIGSKYDRQSYKTEDIIESEIKDIENRKTLILWRPSVLYGGTILEVSPTKIPRIIGKNNTMVEQIAKMTKTTIVVGNNGIIWMKGGNIGLATEAIRKIEDEAHTSGLTERIKQMLEEQQTKETKEMK